MDGFLVVLSHMQDDFPLYLAATEEEANRYAKEASWNAPGFSYASTPCVIKVVQFNKGEPAGFGTVIRDYEKEQESATA